MTKSAASRSPSVKPPAVFLYPGHLHAGGTGHVTTILGTCVAVCLWDDDAAVGGVNHYLLARPPSGERPNPRYGTGAVPELVQAMLQLGARVDRLVAKVFGGMAGRAGLATMRDIGLANAKVAEELLEELGVPVITRDVGGPRGRKLIFDLSNGDAWVKHL